MRLTAFRFSIRSFMVALAVATGVATCGVQALRWARLRADCLQQVDNYRIMLGETEKSLSEAEASLDDRDEQALPAKPPDDPRAAWLAIMDQLRRSREVYRLAISRWQHLADHPWEARPADLYRIE
ncbi:hypothetical protein [Paludisphaera mucosa]|uniref:Uncharacterized protein n=1 Tax=Paludisphaera mucosa TaxID=3030827 RepID=A0ABT6FCI0_9BACT|nr:hypothetical protein [Paludisphaera mucosa]MDG3005302.1 hypothetical protein [Paludisphaera mucosa]